MSLHSNDGKCSGCDKIFSRYPGFHAALKEWFVSFQAKHPEAHISCAGRGRAEQEAQVVHGVSRAHYGKSAHNYNAAIDIFEDGGKSRSEIYETGWFRSILAPALPPWLDWYGKPGSEYHELPHVEVAEWRTLRDAGKLKLVE